MQVRCSFSLLVRLAIWLVVLALATGAFLATTTSTSQPTTAPDTACTTGKEVC